jgi:hypothetical protein
VVVGNYVLQLQRQGSLGLAIHGSRVSTAGYQKLGSINMLSMVEWSVTVSVTNIHICAISNEPAHNLKLIVGASRM